MTDETQTLRREVSVHVSESDGRLLISRLVPYNEVAEVDDGQGPYKERFLPGAFNAQLRASHRIKAFLNFRHRQSLSDQVGHAESIFDGTDGLHGELRVHKTPAGDTALELYNAGVLDKLSIEFRSFRERVVDGVVERLDARLLGIAMVPQGAYEGAEVLAVREQPETVVFEPIPLDPALAASLARLMPVSPTGKAIHETVSERLIATQEGTSEP